MKASTKKIVLVAGFVVIFILIPIIWAIISQPRPEIVRINNFSQYVKNLPDSERTNIEHGLYLTISLNSPNHKVPSIGDAMIRSGSYSQSLSNDIYTTKFKVDIKSVKQSYQIANYYSRLSPDKSGLTDFTVQVSCLAPSDLIYGDFGCRDAFSESFGLPKADPIVTMLPRSTDDYTLTLTGFGNDHRAQLMATIYIHGGFTDDRIKISNIAVGQLKNINDWLTSKNLDPSNYVVNYITTFKD